MVIKKLTDFGFPDHLEMLPHRRYKGDIKKMSDKENKVNDGYVQATTGDVIKLEEGESIEGVFMNIELSSQYEDSWAVSMEVNKETKVLFVNNIIKDLLEKNSIMVGQEIKIVFTGKKKNEAGTREYNDFELYFKPV